MAVAIAATKAFKRIETNRKWEDYQSLKRYWSAHGNTFREVIWEGSQTSTAALAEFVSGAGTIGFLGANDIVYAAQELDDANYDGKTIWIDYCDSSGVLHEAVATVLDSDTSTATEVPIGCLGTPYVEPIASRQADGVTMTAIQATLPNQFAGWYIVACGDATHQEGNYLTVTSSDLSAGVVLKTSTAPDADWADDNVSLQKTLNNDVYRIRRVWTETEGAATKAFHIVDKDSTNAYAIIPDTLTYGDAGSRYTALDTATYRSFLGRIKLRAPKLFDVDADDLGLQVTVTFTPLPETDQTAADTTISFDWVEDFDWQPCIELAEASDVIIKFENLQNVSHGLVSCEFTCLEVTI